MHVIVIRNGNRRDGDVFQAESAVALFAVEMDVDVVVLVIVMAVAEFVAHPVAGIVKDMHEMRLAESLQRPENVGFVNGFDNGFQFSHGHRTARRREGAGDHDAVRRRLDAVAFHQVQQVFLFHHNCKNKGLRRLPQSPFVMMPRYSVSMMSFSRPPAVWRVPAPAPWMSIGEG